MSQRITIEIRNPGRQERDYGPSVAEAVIKLEGYPKEQRFWAVYYFKRNLVDAYDPEDVRPSTDWFVWRIKDVTEIDDDTFYVRAERPYDD